MKRTGRLLLLLLLVAAAGGGYWYFFGRTTDDGAEGPFEDRVVVERGELSVVVEGQGLLTAVQTQSLTFSRLAGYNKLLAINFVEGNTVAEGDVIATVDPEPYRLALEKARSELEAAEKRLAEAQAPAGEQQRIQADLQVARSAQALSEARSALEALRRPDLSRLQAAVDDASDALALARYDLVLAEHAESAKVVRDLRYVIDWHGRQAEALRARVQAGEANLEETQELAAELQAQNDSRGRLADTEADRSAAVEIARRGVAAAEGDLAAARRALVEARTEAGGPAVASATAKAELAVDDAEVEASTAQEARKRLDAGPDAATVAAAQIEVDRKQLAVAEAEQVLAGTELTAPFGGMLLFVSADPEEYVQADTTIAYLANLDRLQVLLYVLESDIRDIEAGQEAEIVFDALPDVHYAGRVESVPLQGTVQKDITYYVIPLALSEPVDPSLRLDSYCTVKIQTARTVNGLLAPSMAIQTDEDGLTYVVAPNSANPDEPERIAVEVGVTDGTRTEIVDGVQEGQVLVVPLRSNTPFGR